MLPRRDGVEVLTTLRKRGLQTPVLILTAKDTVDDRVQGLDLGADDYLVKPFAFPELVARIRALLRRGRMDQVLKLQLDDLEMDLLTRRVARRGLTLDLTAKEFELLEYLLRHQGRVVSREMLARDVWQGTVLYRTEGWERGGLARALQDGRGPAPRSWTSSEGRRYRVQTASGPSSEIAVAIEETSLRRTLRTLAVILIMGVPCAVGLALAGGYVLAGRVLSPIGTMADKARKITAESLGERLPVENPEDEFGRLATVFNDTLSRLNDSFARLRRFTADASHELRTPLTAMRSVGEVALQRSLDRAAYRDVIGSMLEEVDRLTRLVESLLTLTDRKSV